MALVTHSQLPGITSNRISTLSHSKNHLRSLGLLVYLKKLSWCWQTYATHLEVSQGHQT